MIKLICGDWDAIPDEVRARITANLGCGMLRSDQYLAQGICLYESHKAGNDHIIFTNNDHILNGIRVAAYEQRKERKLQDLINAAKGVDSNSEVKETYFDPEDVSILYYREGSPNTGGWLIMMSDKGGLSEWPEGFFSAFDDSLGRLLA